MLIKGAKSLLSSDEFFVYVSFELTSLDKVAECNLTSPHVVEPGQHLVEDFGGRHLLSYLNPLQHCVFDVRDDFGLLLVLVVFVASALLRGIQRGHLEDAVGLGHV